MVHAIGFSENLAADTPLREWSTQNACFRTDWMTKKPVLPDDGGPPQGRLTRVAVLVAGLTVGQIVLFAPSLCGKKLLLPLDTLARRHYYLPPTPEYASVKPFDRALADQVLLFEFERRFAAKEFRAGRIPLWTPDIFIGAPYAVWGKYAPLNWLYYALPSPVTLAWMQLVKSLLAGVGAYLFFRRVIQVRFWPAAIGAWCYPLTGFFIFWQGYPQSEVAAWFPWLLLATDGVVRRPLGWGVSALAAVTCVVLITRVDAAAQALVVSAAFALWQIVTAYTRERRFRGLLTAAAAAAAGWVAGCLLAAPYLLPLWEYTRSGERIIQRTLGTEERPPGGLHELPRLVLPDIHGTTRTDAWRTTRGNLLESGAAAYAGLIATMLVAPLAWASRRHRSACALWTLLAILSLGWTFNVPGIVHLLRSPGINVLSHNRLTFVAGFSLTLLTVIGLEVLAIGSLVRRWWFALPVIALTALALWCSERISQEPTSKRVDLEGVALCTVALCGWLYVWRGAAGDVRFLGLVAALMLGELLWFAHGRNPQYSPRLYYPDLPPLEKLAAVRDRVLGIDCLPANLPAIKGLHDIRGYDSMDPRLLIELLAKIRDPGNRGAPYANLLFYHPFYEIADSGEIRLPPIVDMLGVRYAYFRGNPPAQLKTILAEEDYYAAENLHALPRAFVPKRVERAPDDGALLTLMASRSFNARETSYVDRAIPLPSPASGKASIVAEGPRQVSVEADLATPGIVVLADLFYDGWKAESNGENLPILRTNYALRGVMVPAGHSTIVFSYEPQSFVRGVWLFVVGLGLMIAWTSVGSFLQKSRAVTA
jgi:hypothetical protein